MTRRYLLIAIAATLILFVGCGDMLNQQAAKERDLGKLTEENIRTKNNMRDNIVSFAIESTGVYRVVAKDLNTAEDAAKFGYNCMVVLDERDKSMVKTGIDRLRIIGEQDGTVIFEVDYGTGDVRPTVTLKGPYEGVTWEPEF